MKEKFLRWSEKAANHRHAMRTLFWVSFIESSLSPFPVYFLVLFILAHKVQHSWQKVAFVATISSVLGGLLGYIIGFYFFQLIGQPLLDFYHFQEQFNTFGNSLKENQFWILTLASMTPIPYKIITIASGVFAINIPLFLLTSILGRGIKYFIVAYVTQKYSIKVKEAMLETFWSTVIIFLIILFVMFYFLLK